MLAEAYSYPAKPVPPFHATTLATIAPNNSLESILEPLDRLNLIDTVTGTNSALASSSLGYPLTRSCPITTAISTISLPSMPISLPQEDDLHAAVKVHSIDTNCRIIFDTQIDMFADSKPEIPRLREILPSQLVFLYFQTTLEDFFGFGTTDGDMDGDFFVTSYAECADCVAGFACGGGEG